MDELKFGDPRLPERFWNRHTVDSQGCWVWNSDKSIATDGRAQLKMSGRLKRNYAITSDLIRGPLPLGMTRSHVCPGGANPLCANPQHIVIESHADNCARERKYEAPPNMSKKEYRKVRDRGYYQANREKILSKGRNKGRNRDYYHANKDEINRRARERYHKNKAKKSL